MLIDDREIADLHGRYLHKDDPTDVLSFDLTEPSAGIRECEIYISAERASDQARTYGVALENEILRLTAHALFHLLDYDDTTVSGREEMARLEDQAIERFRHRPNFDLM